MKGSAALEDTLLPRMWPGVLRVIAAVLVSVVAVTWIAMSGNDLGYVSLTDQGGWPGEAPSRGWAVSNGLLALALVLWVTPARDSRLGAATSALCGSAMILLGLTVLGGVMASAQLSYPDRQCFRTDCWPQHIQELLALAPAGLAAIALALQAALPPRWRWRRRALIPVVVLVATTIIQLMVWSDVVVPFLRTDPAH